MILHENDLIDASFRLFFVLYFAFHLRMEVRASLLGFQWTHSVGVFVLGTLLHSIAVRP